MADSLVTFWRHGFEGSSVEELERATGLGRSSLYNTFGNKRALFLAALDRYAQAFQEGPLGILMHGTAGLDDLLAFYTALGGHQDADAPTGCLMVNSLVELGSVADPDVQRRVDAYQAAMRHAFVATLGRAAARGEITPRDVTARAEVLLTLTIGLAARARGGGLQPALDSITGLVRSWAA
ncbi:MAG: TetR/AcrR family transcriptional regulator [Thermoleophilia bacterium]